MFSALRQGSILYILEKGDTLKYRVSTVDSITQPKPKYNTSPYGGTPTMVVDINVHDKEGNQEFRDVPAALSYADFDNVGVIISETRDQLSNYLTGRLNDREQIINNIDFYKQDIINCKEVLKQINPEYAKREEQDERINTLAKELGEIKTGFGNMQGDIKTLLSLMNKPGNN